jgi:hypothetical protein
MKKSSSKERLFEVMGRLDKTFKPRLNEERDWDFWAKEKNAGLEDQGDHYEVETGEMIPVDKYSEYKHGKIIGMYDSQGNKIPITKTKDPSQPIVQIIPKKEPTPEEKAKTEEDNKKITDALIKAGFFTAKSSDTYVSPYKQGENWHGWNNMVKFLEDGVKNGLWSKRSAEDYGKRVWRSYD